MKNCKMTSHDQDTQRASPDNKPRSNKIGYKSIAEVLGGGEPPNKKGNMPPSPFDSSRVPTHGAAQIEKIICSREMTKKK
jgi:hypothetical protein